jgi:Rap1a immunity proteins
MPVGDKGLREKLVFRSRLSLSALFLVATLMASGRAISAEDQDSANFVMSGCRDILTNRQTTDLFKRGLCNGLISGLVYGNLDICLPSNITHEQEARVVVQHIDNRPARMNEDFRDLALEALKAAWPCQRNK